MLTEVAPCIWRIRIELPKNPLKNLNCYLIRGEDRSLLIDTGFPTHGCRATLEGDLDALGIDREKLDVLCTHMHRDHMGNALYIAGSRSTVYITEQDLIFNHVIYDMFRTNARGERYALEGVPPDYLKSYSDLMGPVTPDPMDRDPRVHGLRNGEIICAGPYRLETVLTPGHTPGNAMFWIEKEGIMLTGDHVLFDITPNITVWKGVEDPLGDYLDSLRKARQYPVRTVLPAHRESGNYAERIDELLRHHAQRVDELRSMLRQYPWATACELAPRMTWKIHARRWEDFPVMQKWFAYGESMAHLDYLLKRGEIERVEKDGVRHYRMREGL